MTRLLLVFSLLAAIAFGIGSDPIAVGQDQPTRYSTERLKSVTFGQHVSRDQTNSANDCVIKQPLPFPVRFPKGSTEVAFQVVFDDKDPWPTELFSAELKAPKALGDTKSAFCKKFEIRMGQPWPSQVVATFSRNNGEVFPAGSYKLLLFAGGVKPNLEVPFSVE